METERPSPQPQPFVIERLGPYQITGELGRGGMGAVYKAVHSETGEPAAVKLLSPHLAHEEGFRSRFEAEIETLRKLNHPNIVRLFGFGEQEPYLFYAMEWIDGSSLEQELRQGRRFDWREVARIALDMCRALRHAHDRGVIHRDIKPGNVLLGVDGRVKLSDFGIARLFGNTRLTGAGNVLGTAEYMAPEQAEGRPVDARADLYSLGALMYALLAQRPLFRGKSLPDMLYKQRFEQPDPIRNFVSDLPEEFERILNQLLEKEPERRIPNAAVLGRRFEAMLQSLSVVPETLAADPDWFHSSKAPAPPAAPAATVPLNEFPATLDLSQPIETPRPEPSSDPISVLEMADEKTIPAPAASTAAPTGATPPITSAATTGRFVVVSEEELGVTEDEEERPPVFSWQTGVLVVALVLLAWTVWWFLQPPSADALYKRIKAKTADGSVASILQAEDDIRKFLTLYSDDPNAAELCKYEEEIDLDKLQNEFDLLVKRAIKRDKWKPIERAYYEAMNYANLDPEVGMAKLQAIIDLYDQPGLELGKSEHCLILARRRLAQLHEETKKRATEQVELLEDRLQEADSLREKEPQRAEVMYRAIVELYSGKPWAAPAVRRARDALNKPSPTKR